MLLRDEMVSIELNALLQEKTERMRMEGVVRGM